MRPDGIGRRGSLMASTCRSNQSFAAWLVAQTRGPASRMPAIATGQRPWSATPEEITPQAKAHIGANHVIGFSSSRSARGAGTAGGVIRGLIRGSVVMPRGWDGPREVSSKLYIRAAAS